MIELPDYSTDAAICRLLASGPLPTITIAEQLAIPDRTVRHRLSRLRQAGVVVTGSDGLHCLVAPALAELPTGTSPTFASPATEVVAAGSRRATGRNVAVWVGVGALAAGCVGAAVCAARHWAPDRPPAPTATPPSPALPLGIGVPGQWSW